MDNQNKELVVLQAIANLQSKGKLLRNSSASNFVVHASRSISAKKTEKPATSNSPVMLSENLFITDNSDKEQDFDDEYSFILDTPAKVRRYELKFRETKNGVTMEFSNFIFGNFYIDNSNENFNSSLLTETFSRNNVIDAMINSFGFMSTNREEYEFSHNLRNEIFNKLKKTQPNVMLTRADNSKVFILKVGEIHISANNSEDRMSQFLVFSMDIKNWTSQVYLCYAKINMNLLETSELYKSNVANVLVSPENLNSSRYIGTVIENEKALGIKKIDIPFAEPISVPVKNISRID